MRRKSKASVSANSLIPAREVALGLLGGGLLMGLAPVNAWPLAWIAMIPLWKLANESYRSHRYMLTGAAIWGLAYHGTALSWILWWVKPVLAMGVPVVAGVIIALFAWLFISVWGAAIGMTWIVLLRQVGRWQPLGGGRQILVGTALWCAVEWVWSRGPLYWTSLSYTQSPHNLVGLQLTQISGPITVTAAIVAVNGLLAIALSTVQAATGQATTGQATTGQVTGPNRAALLFRRSTPAIALFLTLHLLGLILYSRPLMDRPDQSLVVGLVQGNIPTSEKLSASGIRASRQIYLDGYEALVKEGAQLVITPEGSIAQTWKTFTQDSDLLMRAVVSNRVPLLLGTFAHTDMVNDRGPLTQSLLLLSPQEKVVGRYNKVKLVPLGEYIPFERVMRAVIGRFIPWQSLAPGRASQQLQTPFGPMAAGICYESAFAELFRQQVNRGGQLIITSSNNDPYPPRQMMQHHAQDVMRAVENSRWEMRVTNTGISGVVDPKGRSRWISEPGEWVTHIDTLYRRQHKTLYVRWGDWLTPLLLLLSALCLFLNKPFSE
ncbi:MAG: apolipoprotein N-acyltransferase [Cyanobacteria bacterium J06588_5]